jgi:hypothetical protein
MTSESVQGAGGSLTGTDPENRVGDQDTGSPGRPVSSGLQLPGESGHSHTLLSNDTTDFVQRHREVGRAKDLSAPPRK